MITDKVIKYQRIKFFLRRMEKEKSFNITRNIQLIQYPRKVFEFNPVQIYLVCSNLLYNHLNQYD